MDSIVQKAGIKTTDLILEIGPGTGNLTKKLLEAGKMVQELGRRFQGTPFSTRLKVLVVVSTTIQFNSQFGVIV